VLCLPMLPPDPVALLLPFFFFQAEDGIRDFHVTGVQTCALPISEASIAPRLPVAKFTMALIPDSARITPSWAITTPVRTAGSPSLERLRQRIMSSFHRGWASVKISPGKGAP